MAFLWFAEQFGPDYVSQRAKIERLTVAGRARSDAKRKARVLEMIVIEPSGKPRRGEPTRIARDLRVREPTVRGWIEDFQRKVNYLVTHARVPRAQAWVSLKNPSPWAAIERGINRSKAGRNAGRRPRPGRKPY
jgi:hypothetical protein